MAFGGLQRVPFIRLLIPFIAGIFAFLIFPQHEGIIFIYIFTGLCLVYFSFAFFKKVSHSFKNRWLPGFVAFSSIFFAAYAICSLHSSPANCKQSANGMIFGSIAEVPVVKDRSVKVVADIKAIKSNNTWQPTAGKALLYLEKDTNAIRLTTGDQLVFSPQLESIENSGNPNEFDYKRYLSYHLISQQAYLKSNKWYKVEGRKSSSLTVLAENTRQYLLSLFRESGLSGDAYAVASALSLGYKNDLDSEIKQSYSTSGATHILAVSGLHVGIIYAVFSAVFFFMNRKKGLKIIKATLIIIFLWAYAFITGLSPSVMRSATMFSFIVLGQTLNRSTNIYNTMAASAFLLLTINPFSITEIGFQLSYLAVGGIVFFQPRIYSLIKFRYWIPDKIWILTSVAISAQLATTPISLYYFHQFPNYFFLSNLLVIPAAGIIIYLAGFLFLTSGVPDLSHLVGKTLGFIIDMLNQGVRFIETLPGSLTSNISFSIVDLILAYATIFTLTYFLLHRNFLWLRSSLVILILWLGIGTFKSYSEKSQKGILVYNIRGISAINLIDGNDNILFSDIELKENSSMKNFSMKGNWLTLGVNNEKFIDLNKLSSNYLLFNLFRIDNPNIFIKNNFIAFYNKRLAILREKLPSNVPEQPIALDFLVLSKNIHATLNEILLFFKPNLIIIDSSNSKWKTGQWEQEAKTAGIPYHKITQDGAFQLWIE